jgi:hypothetical protein
MRSAERRPKIRRKCSSEQGPARSVLSTLQSCVRCSDEPETDGGSADCGFRSPAEVDELPPESTSLTLVGGDEVLAV